MSRVVGVGGDQMDHVLAKEPSTQLSGLSAEKSGDASSRDLNQAPLLDPGTEEFGVLLKLSVAFRVRENAIDSQAAELMKEIAQRKHLLVREFDQEVNAAIRQREHRLVAHEFRQVLL